MFIGVIAVVVLIMFYSLSLENDKEYSSDLVNAELVSNESDFEKILATDFKKINTKLIRQYTSEYHPFPENFVDPKYKNETIVVWRDENIKKNFERNWSYTYKYDSQSRLVEYSYSACLICSNMAYHYIVTYNEEGNVTRLNNMFGNKRLELKYNSDGYVIGLKSYYSHSKNALQEAIETKI
ncbi:MAG: hypothetical protein ACI85I_000681 [Arenicella sp.]|jgi:hypothetical protein